MKKGILKLISTIKNNKKKKAKPSGCDIPQNRTNLTHFSSIHKKNWQDILIKIQLLSESKAYICSSLKDI